MQIVETLAPEVGVQTACEALAVPRSRYACTRRGGPLCARIGLDTAAYNLL